MQGNNNRMKTSVPSACSILNKCQILDPWFCSHNCTIIKRFQESSDNVPRRLNSGTANGGYTLCLFLVSIAARIEAVDSGKAQFLQDARPDLGKLGSYVFYSSYLPPSSRNKSALLGPVSSLSAKTKSPLLVAVMNV